MSNQWIRAFRYAAQNSRQACPATRSTRSFHSTVSSRASNDAPRDDGPKPENKPESKSENEAGQVQPEAVDQKFLGQNPTATNGESQVRKRPTSGLKSRVSRNRKSDLPPVQIPKSFLDVAVDRHGALNTIATIGSAERYNGTGEDASDRKRELAVDKLLRANVYFDTFSWSDADVEKAIQTLKWNIDFGWIARRLEALGVFATWAAVSRIADLCQDGDDIDHRTQEAVFSTPQPSKESRYWVSALLEQRTSDDHKPLIYRRPFAKLLLQHITKRGSIILNRVALYEPCMVDEVITALRAAFLIRAPRNTRLANICRPVTIINVRDCSGFSVAQDTLQYAAQMLGADVLHLHAHDIAYIVGRYIGQDITRTAGDISLLGYRAAENSGRLKPYPGLEEENEEAETLDSDNDNLETEKDKKRQTSTIVEYLQNSATRGKSEELWEDMKINAALDELIHSADVDMADQTSDQKPLIIHINDFNALNMDETGANIITKIRKVVDEMWLSGRKVALVGSCSTKDAPESYLTAMKGLEIGDRVIHINSLRSTDSRVRASTGPELALWEKQDYLRENDENIVRTLWSLTESSDFTLTHSKRRLGLDRYAESDRTSATGEPVTNYSHGVLPISEIYRIATTMISMSSTLGVDLLSLDCFEVAFTSVSVADTARERTTTSSKASINSKKDPIDIAAGLRKMNPFADNQEEKLMSGLVKAQDIRTTFKDIHAPQETIESIKMLTTLSLIRPEAFSYGVLASDRIPGCLLYGPPGTGKTLLAKAVAKESGANMIEVSGASINNMYVGESEKNVRALFRLAKKKEPMVIFIDEADALLGARGGHQSGNRRETINQFLREWDGMDKMKAFIMVATNRPFDLDEAVLRRLPRKLLIDLPLEADRAAILRIHLKDEAMDETVSIEDMAKRTPLYSGSDLKNVCVAAAMAAVKEELEASERHTGPEPYKWAEKRVLNRRHFDQGLKEIGASVSEDMATLSAIRKFDERYGDSKARKKRKGMGFEVVPEARDSEQARVRRGR
ncbi:hypothetical protein F5B22DRAFT_635220 [Xylaria bambusicola]|uniref:uncharacterized protein n=1 Tax=Xylaria bambusicola TaxID=326684 RepID=UPI002008CB8C|nr:uncharacterized protein F5B22DRAFT_635220 [Xylaria bambusicola]KAI0518535.1 hypothetical protein F5B22DRAFT_635220 [Xylaria bambusicola]